jgi:hypothetical protein
MVISRLSINEAGPVSDLPHLGQVTETLPSNPIGILRISMNSDPLSNRAQEKS